MDTLNRAHQQTDYLPRTIRSSGRQRWAWEHPHLAKFLISLLFVAGSTGSLLSQTATVERTSPRLWEREHLPVSFRYNGKESAQLLTTWRISQATVARENGHIRRYSYVDPTTDLQVIAEVRVFPDTLAWWTGSLSSVTTVPRIRL
jgi:hypothetical protein